VAEDDVHTGDASTVRPRFVSNADKLGYSPPLDGLRGVSIMFVILVHASFVPFASLASMVDIFFVVSGFLITTLLLEEDRRSGRVDLRRFYYRRALRLLPLLYVVLVGTLLAVLVIHFVFGDRDLLDTTISDVLAGGTYTYHVVHPVHSELVGGGDAVIRPLLHLWSLSVEEHFYVFGVLVVLLVIRRRWTNQLIAVFLGAWAFLAIARLTGHVGPRFAWYQRPDALLIGVVMAFVNAKLPTTWSARTATTMRRATTAAAVAICGVIFIGSFVAKPFGLHVPFLVPEGGSLHDGLYWGEFGFSVVSLSISIIVLTLIRCPDHWLGRLLSHRVFTWVGVRSYAVYLIHVPLGVLLMETLGKKVPALALLLYFPLLYVAVQFAHHMVEKPAMRLKSRLAEPGAGARGAGDRT
jgi:peptidoglycan/LPS O-acetylase OafA/YrhL